jgi:hypothetical protein
MPSATAAATPAAAPAPVAPAAPPKIVQPVHRSGLGGIVDSIRDAIAGTSTSKVYQDEHGDKYVKKETLSHGQQWLRVAGTALKGAGAGMAAPKGHALEAGIQAQEKEAAERKKLPLEQQNEINKQQMDKYNMIKLKHDAAAGEFALTRMKVQATDEDVKYAQSQQTREKELGSADLGVYANPAELSKVQEQDPTFWKNVYKNDIVTVPEIAPDGTRKGIHVFLRTSGIGNTPVPQGTQVNDFVPGSKPGEAPKLVPRTLTKPATHDQVDQWNNAALNKYQSWLKDQTDLKDKDAQARQRDSEVLKNKAEANKFNAEATKARSESAPASSNTDTLRDNAEGLADGRLVMGKDIPVRTHKDQIDAAAFNKMANDVSMKKFGLPYSPEIVRQEAHFAQNEKTQAFLNGIDRMIGSGGITGQLDEVLEYAKKAGLTKKGGMMATPWSEVRQWVRERYGETNAKNFETKLSDTQTALGTLIGNPLIGGGESDLKLKTAQGQFGKNATLDNLAGTVQSTKEILERARMQLARNNRYIQQRYGDDYSPARVQTGNVNLHTMGGPPPPPPPPGMVNVQIEGQPVGHIPQNQVAKFRQDHPTAKVF